MRFFIDFRLKIVNFLSTRPAQDHILQEIWGGIEQFYKNLKNCLLKYRTFLSPVEHMLNR